MRGRPQTPTSQGPPAARAFAAAELLFAAAVLVRALGVAAKQQRCERMGWEDIIEGIVLLVTVDDNVCARALTSAAMGSKVTQRRGIP